MSAISNALLEELRVVVSILLGMDQFSVKVWKVKRTRTIEEV